MAESYMNEKFKALAGNDIQAVSAGTYARNGFGPTKEAIATMKKENIDISHYKSSELKKEDIEKADIILAMETHHKSKILELSKEAGDKTYLLGHFNADKFHGEGIPDPIGRSIEFYEKTFEVIKKSIGGFIEWLKK